MRKYFLKETDEEIQFGDVISITLYKDIEDGKVTVERNVEFNEDTLDMMLNLGFVEEHEVKEDINNSLLDFEEKSSKALSEPIENFKSLEKKVDRLQGKTDTLITMHNDYVELITDMLKTFKEFVIGLLEKKNIQPKKDK